MSQNIFPTNFYIHKFVQNIEYKIQNQIMFKVFSNIKVN